MSCDSHGLDGHFMIPPAHKATLATQEQLVSTEPVSQSQKQTRRMHKLKQEHHERRWSINSNTTQLNQDFFGQDSTLCQPLASYTNTNTWKSQELKDREEYFRLRQQVRHIAPEQFKKSAKPTNRPCEIFPQTVSEWKQHKADMLGLICAQKLSDAKKMSAQVAALQTMPKSKRLIKSVFGEGGKVFLDCRGPVLNQPTIWSAEFQASGLPQANWPSFAEFQWDGGSRENKIVRTRCGRFLPAPRVPDCFVGLIQIQPWVKQFPFDQTGPIFDDGPAPIQVQLGNADMDNDPDFIRLGHLWLGSELLKEFE